MHVPSRVSAFVVTVVVASLASLGIHCSSSSSTATGADPSQCKPACGEGKLCCSEPTHMNPPSAGMCVAPSSSGTCPEQP